ncbi:MAG: hypothetical protein QNJ67_10015 [Kiloniellales bacterium]|nr:hypothetical protein [Kiloniellales bacterium]
MANEGLWLDPGSEPSVAELLADPAARLLLRYDGLTADQVWTVVQDAQVRLDTALGLTRPDIEAA